MMAAATLVLAACEQKAPILIEPVTPTIMPSPSPLVRDACQDRQEALAHARPATVAVVTSTATGTAAIIDPRGRAVTAADLVREDEVVALVLPSGDTVAARVAGQATEVGLALLMVEPVGPFPSLTWAPADPQEGEGVIVLGYGRGPQDTLTAHDASIFRYLETGGVRYVQLAQELASGFAGAPVVDLCGRLVGIAVARVRDVPGLALAVAASSARPALAAISPVEPPQRAAVATLLALARARIRLEGFIPTNLEAHVETEGGLFLAVHSYCPSHFYCQKVHFFLNDSYLGTDTLRPSRAIVAVEAEPQRRQIVVTYANYAPGDRDDAPSLPPVRIPYWWDGQRLRAGGVPPGH
jgi:S1-C subfamily serine protease